MNYRWFLVREKYRVDGEEQIFRCAVWANSGEDALKRFRGFYPHAINFTAEETDQDIAEGFWAKIR